MDDDEESLCPFGTPLEPLEEDEIPSKKPISIEDQVVTDSSGRRRFHGAFTGGFSAGFGIQLVRLKDGNLKISKVLVQKKQNN